MASNITGLNERYEPKLYGAHYNYAPFSQQTSKKCIFWKKILSIHNSFNYSLLSIIHQHKSEP